MTGSPSEEVLVRCEGVARTFGVGSTAIVAVRRVDCEVRAGQRLVITGPSGSGKSTLLHLLAGLDEPTVGTINWPALGARNSLRPGPVGVVFQGPSLLPALDVVDNVALPLVLGGMSEASGRAVAATTLERLELSGLGAKLPDELSGGQSQRVAVARVLAGNPRLMLADEPTGQLDRVNARLVITQLLRAADETGAALVVSTHDPRVADHFDDHWRMADGRLLRHGAEVCGGAPSSS